MRRWTRRKRLTLDHTPGCSFVERSRSNANWYRREEDWAQRRRDLFLRAQRLTTASAENAGRFPPISRHRRRNRCLCSSCAGVGIHTQRDSTPAETARESLAALCTGTAAPSRKARRCTAKTQGPSEARARAAIGAPQLQQRTAQ